MFLFFLIFSISLVPPSLLIPVLTGYRTQDRCVRFIYFAAVTNFIEMLTVNLIQEIYLISYFMITSSESTRRLCYMTMNLVDRLVKGIMGSSTTVITPEVKTMKDMKPLVKPRKERQETSANPGKSNKYDNVLVWRNIIIFLYVHIGGVYGLYLILTSHYSLAMFGKTLIIMVMSWAGGFGQFLLAS